MLNGVLDKAYQEVVAIYREHVQVLLLPEKAERSYIAPIAKLWVGSKMCVGIPMLHEENQEKSLLSALSQV